MAIEFKASGGQWLEWITLHPLPEWLSLPNVLTEEDHMRSLSSGLVFSVLLGFSAIPVAHAQWFSHASQPDVFGNRTVNAVTTAPTGDGLTIQCNQKDSLNFAYVFPVTPQELDILQRSGGFPVTLLLKVDNNSVMKFDAAAQDWNNKYGGFVASGRSYAIVQAIKEISEAQRNISIGVNFMGNQESDNFSPIGSTAAMNTVIHDCKLDSIKPDQTPAPSSGQAPANSDK